MSNPQDRDAEFTAKLDYHQAISYLMGLFGEVVIVYVGISGEERNVALLTGVLESGVDCSHIGRHEDFRDGSIFFWVNGRYACNGFFMAEENFLEARLDDEDPCGLRIEQRGGMHVDIAPLEDDLREASTVD